MKKQFEILKATRNNILKAIDGLALEELNTIPAGFNNNIIWNVAHVVVTQQLLCYQFSGLEMVLDAAFVDSYKKGSIVNDTLIEQDVEFIKNQLLILPQRLEEDYNNSVFKNYDEYSTSYNVTLDNIEDAIKFNNVHESLHLGYIMAMKKSL